MALGYAESKKKKKDRLQDCTFEIYYKVQCFKWPFSTITCLRCVKHPFALLNEIFSAVKLNSPEIINAVGIHLFYTYRIFPQYVCKHLYRKFKPANSNLAFLPPSTDGFKAAHSLYLDKICTAREYYNCCCSKSFILNLTFRETQFPSNSLTEAKGAWARRAGSSQEREHANRDLPHHPKHLFSILAAINSNTPWNSYWNTVLPACS